MNARLALAGVLPALVGAAAAAPLDTNSSGLAAYGDEVVAFRNRVTAVSGDRRFRHAWTGATSRFSTAADLDAFAAQPARRPTVAAAPTPRPADASRTPRPSPGRCRKAARS